MKKDFFIFSSYFTMLYLEGAVTATGKYNISFKMLIPCLIKSCIVFPKYLSFTMIKGVQKNKDDYYGK